VIAEYENIDVGGEKKPPVPMRTETA